MAEATVQANDSAEGAELRRAAHDVDRARMRQMASYHFALVTAGLTVWGAAATWAQVTGWGIAQLAALAGAVVAGSVIAPAVHEWGHFAGARLSGAVSPVLAKPRRHFFIFDFPMEQNDTRQFLWMSWGGILAPWAAAIAIAASVPLGLASAAALCATLISKAVAVAVFEVPVASAVANGGTPGPELGRQLKGGGLARASRMGTIAGFAIFGVLLILF